MILFLTQLCLVLSDPGFAKCSSNTCGQQASLSDLDGQCVCLEGQKFWRPIDW